MFKIIGEKYTTERASTVGKINIIDASLSLQH